MKLQYFFAPNNFARSKPLFTGRTRDLEHIFRFIEQGKCVALYGERRGGKSLTLWAVHAIINGDIEDYKNTLIDERFLGALPDWGHRLKQFKAVLISLAGTSNEKELLQKLLDELHELGIEICPLPGSLRVLLDKLQRKLSEDGQKLVILVDEMDLLDQYKSDIISVSQAFCNREKHSDLIFVHAGSYGWKEHVSGSVIFRHLGSYYLDGIDESDMLEFLLKPLQGHDMKSFVVKMSGNRPMYAQYIGEAVYESGRLLSKDELKEGDSLCDQIQQSIYYDEMLDNGSKNILAMLAYHPNSTSGWIASRLRLSRATVKKKIRNLERFGAISKSKRKYRVVGDFIEAYGKEICDDPSRRWPLVIRFIIALLVVLSALYLYSYAHPSRETEIFRADSCTITIEHPKSVENGEKGKLNISVRNASNTSINLLDLSFDSECIAFSTHDGTGKNALSFSNLKPYMGYSGIIEYRVRQCRGGKLGNRITGWDGATEIGPFPWEINRRSLPLKRFSPFLNIVLLVLGPLVPGKHWARFGELSKVLNLSQGKQGG